MFLLHTTFHTKKLISGLHVPIGAPSNRGVRCGLVLDPLQKDPCRSRGRFTNHCVTKAPSPLFPFLPTCLSPLAISCVISCDIFLWFPKGLSPLPVTLYSPVIVGSARPVVP
ncbi:hypothetical protein PoB_006191500 [Plakobranchus ocellatus]|uniref:Uncharacterized protein n=1 Tax=Plakobranchus ocellatus TaxID=259542 RepID=A0AAV4CU82_9GAST|nr:hypothetical protein PoB_006191500 [Plakobranchus ocellatus]